MTLFLAIFPGLLHDSRVPATWMVANGANLHNLSFHPNIFDIGFVGIGTSKMAIEDSIAIRMAHDENISHSFSSVK